MTTSTNQKYCLIGDLHGRMATLNRILDQSSGSDYHYVFLGDTIHHKQFFHRTKKTPPTKILKKIKTLVDEGRATLILGNNENYILRSLVLPSKQIKRGEVKYTLKCLKELELEDRLSLLHWLSTSPLTLELKSYGKTYRLAHAYYLPTYSSETRNLVLTGPGYPWFKQDDLTTHLNKQAGEAEYFFGHYGYPYFRHNLHIIDATNFEGVGVYYTDREEFMVYY